MLWAPPAGRAQRAQHSIFLSQGAQHNTYEAMVGLPVLFCKTLSTRVEVVGLRANENPSGSTTRKRPPFLELSVQGTAPSHNQLPCSNEVWSLTRGLLTKNVVDEVSVQRQCGGQNPNSPLKFKEH